MLKKVVEESDSLQAQEMFLAKTPLKRVGQPEEVAKLMAFLLSDENTYITGTTIAIDGGVTCH